MAKGSGGTKSVSKKQQGFRFEKETEKAVLVNVKLTGEAAPEGGFVSSLVRDWHVQKKVWLPKSQMTQEGASEWILKTKAEEIAKDNTPIHGQVLNYTFRYTDSQGKEIKSSMTAKDKEIANSRKLKFEAGVKRHNELIAEAKKLGIKGIRQTMKNATLEKKIEQEKSKKGGR